MSLTVKFYHKGETRRFHLEPPKSGPVFALLVQRIRTLEPDLDLTKTSLHWKDDEGDCIALKTDSDVREALKQAMSGLFKIYAMENASPTTSRSASASVPMGPIPLPYVGAHKMPPYGFGGSQCPPATGAPPMVPPGTAPSVKLLSGGLAGQGQATYSINTGGDRNVLPNVISQVVQSIQSAQAAQYPQYYQNPQYQLYQAQLAQNPQYQQYQAQQAHRFQTEMYKYQEDAAKYFENLKISNENQKQTAATMKATDAKGQGGSTIEAKGQDGPITDAKVQGSPTTVANGQNGPTTDAFGYYGRPTTNAFGYYGRPTTNAFGYYGRPTPDTFGYYSRPTIDTFGYYGSPTTDTFGNYGRPTTDTFGYSGRPTTDTFGYSGRPTTDTFGYYGSPTTDTFGNYGRPTTDAKGYFGPTIDAKGQSSPTTVATGQEGPTTNAKGQDGPTITGASVTTTTVPESAGKPMKTGAPGQPPASNGNTSHQGSDEEHKGVVCDKCDEPIRGKRFKCIVCRDFDLCEECDATRPTIGDHDSNHPVLRVNRPRDYRGWMVKTSIENLLKHGPVASGAFNRDEFLKNVGSQVANALDAVGIDVEVHTDSGCTVGCPAKTNSSTKVASGAAKTSSSTTTVAAETAATTAGGKSTYPDKTTNAAETTTATTTDGTPFSTKTEVTAEVTTAQNVVNQAQPIDSAEVVIADMVEGTGPSTDWVMLQPPAPITIIQPAVANATFGQQGGPFTVRATVNRNDVRETAQQGTAVSVNSMTSDAHIVGALEHMLAMGYTNEGGWLSQLLIAKHGDISAVLDVLAPVNRTPSMQE